MTVVLKQLEFLSSCCAPWAGWGQRWETLNALLAPSPWIGMGGARGLLSLWCLEGTMSNSWWFSLGGGISCAPLPVGPTRVCGGEHDKSPSPAPSAWDPAPSKIYDVPPHFKNDWYLGNPVSVGLTKSVLLSSTLITFINRTFPINELDNRDFSYSRNICAQVWGLILSRSVLLLIENQGFLLMELDIKQCSNS